MQNYYNPYYSTQPNGYPTQMNVGTSQPTQPQIQNGGFITIPHESMVDSYPVEMGKCVTFKVEGKPIVLEKSKGFSQFEPPMIKRFRLVEEEEIKEVKEATPENIALDGVKEEIKSIWSAIEEIKGATKKAMPKHKDNGGEN